MIQDIVQEFLFWFDIVLYFFREFEAENSPIPIRDFNKIAVRYLKGSFVLDLLAMVPFVFSIIKDSTFEHTQKDPESYEAINLLYLLKLLRLRKTNDVLSPMFFSQALKSIYQSRLDYIIQNTTYFDHFVDYNKIVDQIRISYMFQIIRLGFIVFFTSYLLALFSWILLDIEHKGLLQTDDHKETFIHLYGLEAYSSYNKMIVMIYWAFTTLSTIGLGDYHPKNNQERIACSVFFLFGVTCFTFITNHFLTVINKMLLISKENEDYNNLSRFFGLLRKYNKNRKLSKEYMTEIEDFFDYYWTNDHNYCLSS